MSEVKNDEITRLKEDAEADLELRKEIASLISSIFRL